MKIFLRNGLQNARLNTLYTIQARTIRPETFYGRNAIAFKKKLSSNILSITIYTCS